MALIGCPECEDRVSSHAKACPHCGYPVAEARQSVVEELTGSETAKSTRQRSAAQHMAQWARGYTQREPGSSPLFPGETGGSRWFVKLAIGVVVIAVVVIQVIWLYSMARR